MWFVVGVFFHFCVFCSLCVFRFLCVHACVLRCGFSLIFERGLEEDICFLRITQKSTWFQRGMTSYTYKDKEAFEPKWTFLRFNGCWVFNWQRTKFNQEENVQRETGDKCDQIQSEKKNPNNCNQFNLSARHLISQPIVQKWISSRATHPPSTLCVHTVTPIVR